MRYYVYALIDPSNNNQPFYIGKGLDNRLQSHFKKAMAGSTNAIDSLIKGCDTKSIMTHAINGYNQTENTIQLSIKINKLLARGYNHTQIGRVIGKKLDESTALAVEACLIKSVYGIDNLINLVEGERSERFRPYNVWNFVKGYDLDYSDQGLVSNALEHKLGKYYIYVLRDPSSEEVFYVGKGTGNRLIDHFKKSSNLVASASDADRLLKIRQLLACGLLPHDIGRIVARVAEESHAFILEALFLKFVFGLKSLTNIQPGNHSEKFRAKNDWEIRKGFDLPYVVTPGVRVDRSEKLDGMLGEGLQSPLIQVQNAFPNLNFDPPKILGAADLSIEADVGNDRNQAGARIRIFIRREKIQMALTYRIKSQREWIIAHLTQLGAYPLRRADDI